MPSERSHRAVLALILASGALLSGCAAGQVEVGEISKLQSEVASLRSQQTALLLRLEGLERRQTTTHERAASAPVSAELDAPRSVSTSERPMLEVVRLTPESAPAQPAEELAAPVKLAPDAASLAFMEAKGLFQKRSFDKALTAFSAFVSKYPDHPDADLAIYHRGLCFFQQGQHKKAAEQFEAVAAFAGPRELTADALFELAKSKDRLGEVKDAQHARSRIKSDFPQSAAAKRLPR